MAKHKITLTFAPVTFTLDTNKFEEYFAKEGDKADLVDKKNPTDIKDVREFVSGFIHENGTYDLTGDDIEPDEIKIEPPDDAPQSLATS